MMDYINWLSNVEPALHNLNKSHFVVVNNLLEHCWIWLINMLLWVFAFMFMRYFWSMHVCAKSLLQFSCSVMSDSLWPHRLQHSRLPCSSPNTKACSNSCPSMPSNHLILCHPLLLLPSTFSNIRVFSSESTLCMRWPKHWSFSFSISPSNEYSGLISFGID